MARVEEGAAPRAFFMGDVVLDRRGDTASNFPPHLAGKKIRVSSFAERDQLIVDLFPIPPVFRSKRIPAGNGTNTALGVQKLRGEPGTVTLSSTIGNADERLVRRTLDNAGILYDLTTHPGYSPEGSVIVNGEEKNRLIVSFKPLIVPQKFQPPETPPDWIYLTSLVGEGWEDRYVAVAEYAQRHKSRLLVAPGTVQMEEKGRPLYDTIAQATGLFVNREEALRLLGRDETDTIETQDLLVEVKLGLGPGAVMLTNGVEGSHVIDASGILHDSKAHIIPKSRVKDLSGAGDAWAAGYLAGQDEGMTIEQSMWMGALNAASTIRRRDANFGQLTRVQMNEALARHPMPNVEPAKQSYLQIPASSGVVFSFN